MEGNMATAPLCKKCKDKPATYLSWYNKYGDYCRECYYDTSLKDRMKEEDVPKYRNERDKWGLPEIRTNTGHRVRSRGECLIANWLYENNIPFEYERIVYLDGEANKYLISDFYLPVAKLYLEYWGQTDIGSYNLRREEKEEIYKEKKYNLLNIEDNHINSLDDYLRKNLLKYFKHL